jgi:hypothetical protein
MKLALEEKQRKETEKLQRKMDKISEAKESEEDTNGENFMVDINDNIEEQPIMFDDEPSNDALI